MTILHTDIIIVGAGSVGMSLFLALSQQNRRVILLERGQLPIISSEGQSRWDARNYAINLKNYQWLAGLGIQNALDLQGTPMRAMHVVYEAGNAFFELSAAQLRSPFLAWMMRHDHLNMALSKLLHAQAVGWLEHRPEYLQSVWTSVQMQALELRPEDVQLTFSHEDKTYTIHAQCIVGADGADSWVRKQVGGEVHTENYAHEAVVGCFQTEHPHAGIAYQWFKKNGEIMAWLPTSEGIGVVWSRAKLDELTYQNYLDNPDKLADELSQYGSNTGKRRLGRWYYQGGLSKFPLSFQRLSQSLSSRVVLMGDARHRIHPLSGQGMNLGLLEARQFIDALQKFPLKDSGHTWLAAYRAKQESLAQHLLPYGVNALWHLNQPERLPSLAHALIGKGWSFFHQSGILKRLVGLQDIE